MLGGLNTEFTTTTLIVPPGQELPEAGKTTLGLVSQQVQQVVTLPNGSRLVCVLLVRK